MVAIPGPARAQPAAIWGNEGGRYFEYSCGPGQVLNGLSGSAGVLIDNIQAICARVDQSGNMAGASVQGPIFGHDRPQDKHVECPAGFAIIGANIKRNNDHGDVGAIILTCKEIANRIEGGETRIDIRGTGNLDQTDSDILFHPESEETGGFSSCPNNYAIGIRGRAGPYLSAFGLICGAAAAYVDPNAGHRLGKRKKRPELIGQRPPGGQGTSFSYPGASEAPRLGKRKRPMPTGGAGSESNPNAGQPGLTDGSVGASIFTDGSIPPPSASGEAPAPQREPPSPLINGTYATTLSVTDSRCFTQDLRGTWAGMAELQPQPAILVPLQNFGPMFAAPVMIQVEGLVVRQSTQVQMRAGPVAGAVPAEFNGAFTNDGNRFNVRFTAGTPICRIDGTISGIRN
jgi:hypothetical protein